MELKVDPSLNDETPVELTNEQQAAIKKAASEILTAVSYLNEIVGRRELTVATRVAVLGTVEHHIADLSKIVGYDGDLVKEMEQRYAEIGGKNLEIRRLEKLIGSQKPIDGLAQQLSVLSENVHKFWIGLGFALVYDTPSHAFREMGGFGAGYGNGWYVATLAAMISDDDKITAGRLMQNLDILNYDGHISDMEVLDTQRNRKWIYDKLKERFPSVAVTAWDIKQERGKQEEVYRIDSLQIRISNLADLTDSD